MTSEEIVSRIINKIESDPIKRNSFFKLYSLIREKGAITKENTIIDEAKKRGYCWSCQTIRKRIRLLVVWGLLNIRKSEENENWNVITIVDGLV